jgi:hypothetical protein
VSTATQPAKPKRRWYQFSLLTLLVVMTVFCATVGWIGHRILQARRNIERKVVAVGAATAVREIEKMGGTVTYSHEVRRTATLLEDLFGDPGAPDDPVRVLVVVGVKFDRASATDAGLIYLKEFGSLRVVYLGTTDVSDVGIQHLDGLISIKQLELGGTNVSDAGLQHLKSLKNLQSLELMLTNVTDDGLEHLSGMTKLSSLGLRKCNITDAGLKHLAALSNLHSLDLKHTQVTREGVKKLQQALPNCKIFCDYSR